MTFPGLGGQQPPPQNAPAAMVPVPGITPGTPPVLTVTEIIITPGGVLEGIFTYSSNPPAAGTLTQTSNVATGGTDKYGNHYLSGVTTYDNAAGTATQMDGGAISLYTGSLAGGWTSPATIFISSGGVIELVGNGVITSNNTLDNGAGGMSVVSLSVNGSTHTTQNGLSSPGIVGTSGAASAGTAHTHSAGSYTVGSGQHQHSSFGG